MLHINIPFVLLKSKYLNKQTYRKSGFTAVFSRDE